MTIATTTLSSKGQVVIPKSIRDELHWESGHEQHDDIGDDFVFAQAVAAFFGTQQQRDQVAAQCR